MPTVKMDDPGFMREAIRLARQGFPAPNPHVGCVIVRNGEIVGRGYHDHAGGPHAEVVALRDAGEQARGATAYVTLEPCNHTGRTGPCSLALIEAGVRRVVVALKDPNPRAEGGLDRLREEGIETESGLLEEEAAEVCHQFLFSFGHQRPLVVLKAASSLDGRIALPTGESKWITGPIAREAAHRLRAELGAVLVGRRTVELDDPLLTARIPGVHNQPVRVVLDPKGKLGRGYRVFNDEAPTLHMTASNVATKDGVLDLAAVLGEIREAGATGVLIEGGAATLGEFVRQGYCDRLELFIGPRILGVGPSWIEKSLGDSLPILPRFMIDQVTKQGEDLQITAKPTTP